MDKAKVHRLSVLQGNTASKGQVTSAFPQAAGCFVDRDQ